MEAAGQKRPWAVHTCGRLLKLEGAGLLALAWLNAPPAGPWSIEEGWVAGLLAVFGALAIWAGLGLQRMRPSARNQATLAQGAVLALGLALYWGARPGYVYGLLAGAIFLVLYLQHPDVRDTFPIREEIVGEEKAADEAVEVSA